MLPWVLVLVLMLGNFLPVRAATQPYYFDTEYMAQLANEFCGRNEYTDFAAYCYYIKDDIVKILAVTDGLVKGNYNSNMYSIGSPTNANYGAEFAYDITSDSLSCTSVHTYWNLYYKDTVDSGNFYATTDIYDRDGNLFFQLTRPRLHQIAAGISAEALQREILTMIPLLIPLLAGYLGLRKALREISRILRTA